MPLRDHAPGGNGAVDRAGFKYGEFPTVKAPTLSIYGKDEKFFLHTALNEAWEWIDAPLTLQILPGVNHGPHKETPEFVTPRIMEWLKTFDRTDSLGESRSVKMSPPVIVIRVAAVLDPPENR